MFELTSPEERETNKGIFRRRPAMTHFNFNLIRVTRGFGLVSHGHNYYINEKVSRNALWYLKFYFWLRKQRPILLICLILNFAILIKMLQCLKLQLSNRTELNWEWEGAVESTINFTIKYGWKKCQLWSKQNKVLGPSKLRFPWIFFK